MTDYLWPAVALVVAVLAFAAVMRWLGNAPRATVLSHEEKLKLLQAHLEEHVKTWDLIGTQWRQKVAELDEKCDRVVINAKNEIAGDLATVSNITNKGWR